MANPVVSVTIRAINQIGDTFRQISGQVRSLGSDLERLDKLGSKLQSVGGALTTIGTTAAAVGAGITAPLALATKQAIDFETAMSEVGKAMNQSLDSDVMKEMSEEVLRLSRTMPIASTEIAQMVAAGSKLGVPKESLAQFTELTSVISTAFSMTAEEAGQKTAEIMNNFKIIDQKTGQIDFARIERFGDVVNTLAGNMATSEAKIVEFTKRASGLASTLGITENNTAALGAAFTAAGLAPEVAARAFNTLGTRLAGATSLTPSAIAAFEDLGLSAEGIQKSFRENGTDAIQEFLQAVKDTGHDAIPALTAILGQGFTDETLQAANNLGMFQKALGLAQKQAGDDGFLAMRDTFKVMSETTANQMQLLQNNLTELGVRIGAVILPALNQVISVVGVAVRGFADFATANPQITKVAVAIAAVAGILLTVGGVALVVAGTVIGAIGSIISAWAVIAPIFAGVGAAVGAAILPVIAIIAGLAASAFLVYKFWDPISAFFSGLFSGIASAIAPLAEQFRLLWQEAEPIRQAFGAVFGSLFGQVDQGTAKFQSLGQAIGSFVGLMLQYLGTVITTALRVGIAIGNFFVNLVTNPAQALNAFVSQMVAILVSLGQVFAPIVTTIQTALPGLIQVISGIFAVIGGIFTAIAGVFTLNGQMVITGLSGLFQGLMAVLVGGFSALVGIAQSIVSAISSAIQGLGDAISSGIKGAMGIAQGAIDALMSGLQGLQSLFGKIGSTIAGIGGTIMSQISQIPSAFSALFSRITSAIASIRIPGLGGGGATAAASYRGNIPNAAGGLNLGSLFGAVAREVKGMPSGSNLAIANTSEFILTPKQIGGLATNLLAQGFGLGQDSLLGQIGGLATNLLAQGFGLGQDSLLGQIGGILSNPTSEGGGLLGSIASILSPQPSSAGAIATPAQPGSAPPQQTISFSVGNITINAGSTSDPEALADMVIRSIERKFGEYMAGQLA